MAISNPHSVISSEESFLLSIFHSFWRNRCVSVIVGLKIPDVICSSQETSMSIDEIAAKSGCDSTKQLYPILRLAAQWGIVRELDNKHFAKNKALELLRRDQGPSIGHMFEYFMGDEMFTSFCSLAAGVKHGKPAFDMEHGMTNFQYLFDVENCPYSAEKMYEGASKNRIGSEKRRREMSESYVEGLNYMSRLLTLNDVPHVNTLFKAFPWSECKKIVDIGGSTGDFLASILKLPGCENIQGYVIELPEVVDEAKRKILDLGIAEHRIQFIKQDCFQPYSSELHLEADTVTVKSVLSMFTTDEEKMSKFFTNCRSLFPAKGGRLLIIDYSIPDEGKSSDGISINGLDIGALSMHKLSISTTYVYSKNEWIQFFNNIDKRLGFCLYKIHNTFHGGIDIFELHYKPQN